MFDIAAPIERQFTRDGRKVLAIFDSGLKNLYPICAWLPNDHCPVGYTKEGKFSSNRHTNDDIITRPEQLPLIVTYCNAYESGLLGSHSTLENARRHEAGNRIATLKVTFDPNTGESTAETVWQKEMAK